MEFIDNLLLGFQVTLSPHNFFFCFVGALLGTVVGVLPGLSPVTTIAMLLPLAFSLEPTSSLIMLAGIYYGAHHAGSTTAIMLNMPGEPASVVVCIDGHPMAKQGRAGAALAISALGSFFAGSVSVLIIALFSPTLAHAALLFAPSAYTSIIVLALLTCSALTNSSLLSSVGVAILGVLVGIVGADVNSGVQRFTFGIFDLYDGIDFVPVAVGLFAFTEIVTYLGVPTARISFKTRLSTLLPTRDDLSRAWRPVLRGTALGGTLGILPGMGPLLSAASAYAIEKRISRTPERFGNGAIEGVAAPEAADNAAAVTHFIPMLSLGIPAGAAMALMLGALAVQGVSVGPQLVNNHPELFWGVVASMWLGNIMLLVLNLPLIGVWIKLLSIPYRYLYPAILVFCCVGVYSVHNSVFDVMLAAFFGIVGSAFRILGWPPVPFILGIILGPMLETNFRRSLLMSYGDPSVFIADPISLFFLLLAVALLILFSGGLGTLKRVLRRQPQAASEPADGK